ncbi:hypothetical protein JKL49_18000 [Phenylobacterium sp. 20VBR1]|uniref:CoA transferase n=1 Tax=Phenylobacterium glaciei TaxID=2803784 RepID=A0A941D365_9CAUL|nr:hypothetical protein [Phenylobacterium glaciei]MBR7621291.1 hypothetical protein [Phenylobacterium glaciei]QQZ49944.1 hypothetical protein JKL49_25145 [Phenylobacterium glaciei]
MTKPRASTAASILAPPPTLGQHTDEILAGLGYDSARISALKAGGAV